MASLFALFQEYYRHHQKIGSKKSTLKCHKVHLLHFFEVCKISQLAGFAAEAVQNFIDIKCEEGRSPHTIRSYIQSFKAFSHWLIKKGYMKKNIFDEDISLPNAIVKNSKTVLVSDFKKLLRIINTYPHYADPLDKFRTIALFAMLIFTHLRKGQVLEIQFDQVRLKERCIFFEKNRENEKDFVIINDQLYLPLAEYCAYLLKIKKYPKYLFFNSDPQRPMSDGALNLIKKKIEKYGMKRYKIQKFTIKMLQYSSFNRKEEGYYDKRSQAFLQKGMVETLREYSPLK